VKSAFLLLACLSLVLQSHAAHFTTTVAQAIGSSWNDAIWQPGPTVPTAGNTYEVLNGGLVRNPAVTSSTFPGDSLQLDTNTILRMKPPQDGTMTTVRFPGVNGAPGLILNGGGIDPGSVNTTFVVAGKVLVAADSLMLGPAVDYNRNVIFAASLSGAGNITIQNFFNNSGVTVQSLSNDFSGNWILTSGRLTGVAAGSLGTGNFVVAGGSRLEILYALKTPGVLTLDGVMSLNNDCEVSGAIISGAALPAGIYPYSDLKNRFPNNFTAGGSGSIRVVPPDVSLSISRSADTISIQFKTAIAHKYTVETSSSLDEPISWTNAGPAIDGDGTMKIITQSASAAAYYRVLVE
jgi:hypothetical protein